jgi:hypothetical protein
VDEESSISPDGRAGKKLKLARIGQIENVDLKTAAVAGLGALGMKFNSACAPERVVVRLVSGHPSAHPGVMARPLADLDPDVVMGLLQQLNTARLEAHASALAKQCQWELGAIEGAGIPGIQGQVLAPAERLRQASLQKSQAAVNAAIKKLSPPGGGGPQALPPAPLAPPPGDDSGDILAPPPVSRVFGRKRG